MKLYSENQSYKLYEGNMLEMLDVIEPNSIDAIVTDPPYELGFLGKSWDSSGIAFQKETWEKCLKVLKPGGHMLAFAGSRTQHRIACAIEDAGFEIRDCIMWLYGSAMPKSLNIGLAIDKKNGVESPVIGVSHNGAGASPQKLNNHEHGDTGIGMLDGSGRTFNIKQAQNCWRGFGSQLKPGYEPIIVARKPVEKSIVENVMKWGVGGINIDECRVGNEEVSTHKAPKGTFAGGEQGRGSTREEDGSILYESHQGRFPANLIHDGSEEATKDFPNSKGASSQNNYSNGHIYRGQSFNESSTSLEGYREWYNDDGSASRYFKTCEFSELDDEYYDEPKRYYYCAKANKEDRNCSGTVNNIHTTVKPQSLMKYLVRLVSPKGATILDPFNGSGSTGKAVMLENKERNAGYKYIGIELTPEYLPISKARIEYAQQIEVKVEKKAKATVETKQKEETTKNKKLI